MTMANATAKRTLTRNLNNKNINGRIDGWNAQKKGNVEIDCSWDSEYLAGYRDGATFAHHHPTTPISPDQRHRESLRMLANGQGWV